MIILGLTGAIGHGKTTLADDLAACAGSAVHLESSDLIIEVANALRAQSGPLPKGDSIEAINTWLQPLAAILKQHVHCETSASAIMLSEQRTREHPDYYDKLFAYFRDLKKTPALQAAPITTTNKADFRSLLQWLGGYLVKMADDGVWYDELIRRAKTSEVELVTIGGVRFPGDAERVRAAGGLVVEISRPELATADKTDLTERERAQIRPDVHLYNDGSLTQLKSLAAVLYADLRTGQPGAVYRASEVAMP